MENEPQAARLANIEVLFREVNERIAAGAMRVGDDDTDFVCECGDPLCTERVEATLDEYEDVRDDPTSFLLVPGHEDTRVEAVVEREDGHAVVRKRHPVAAAVARRLDPRAAGGT